MIPREGRWTCDNHGVSKALEEANPDLLAVVTWCNFKDVLKVASMLASTSHGRVGPEDLGAGSP